MSTPCDSCQTLTIDGNKCSVCHHWNCKDCIIFEQEYHSNTSNYFCETCFKNKNPEIRQTCWVCDTIENIEEGGECNTCNHWTCISCISYDDEGFHHCTECFRNKTSESRATCGVCETSDNIEEGADCYKCRHWTCSECVSFGDDGNYYCIDCKKP